MGSQIYHRLVVKRLDAIRNKLQSTGVVIAGGYCSDIEHNVMPKDCDVWIKCNLEQYKGDNREYLEPDLNRTLKECGLKGTFTFHYVNYNEKSEDAQGESVSHVSTVIVQATQDDNNVDMNMDFIFLDNSHFPTFKVFALDIVENFDMDIVRMYIDNCDLYDTVQLTNDADQAMATGIVQVFPDRDNRFFGCSNTNRVMGNRIDKYKKKYKKFNYLFEIVE